MTRYITLRVDMSTGENIDATITEGLQQLSEKHKESMDLINVSSLHRPDGAAFAVIIAKGTGQVRAVKPKEKKSE
jgi:hypothetical protein